MIDPFEQLGEQQVVSPRKARLRAVETRRQRAQKKALNERDKLYELWKKAHEKRKAELLAGPHAEIAWKLISFIEGMTFEDADELLLMIEPWRSLDADIKFLVLSLIDSAIVYMREAEGLPPFDDPIDGELNVFLTIKEMLRC